MSALKWWPVREAHSILPSTVQYRVHAVYCEAQRTIMDCVKGQTWDLPEVQPPELFQLKWNEKGSIDPLCAKQTERHNQGVTKRCRLSLLTNSVLVYESKCRGAMSPAVNIAWHGAQINFGDPPPYLTYGHNICNLSNHGIYFINRCHFFTNWRKVSKWKDKESEKAGRRESVWSSW